ncbi:tripartite-type tricarboxylate transporter receptor subunit TctC [Massilia aurea]|uniref:Tripartite-type tricarboxylate transporter receptor subunit TctC n=1 Tax=Massilia aurea TaxID=373040 RepID=A0A7X0CDX6_9BURK|nr:tripartite tricarboxylate transporter substrate-binding protein [Massilia aurea]MBB6133722.1 tripartite-type tricarboxylate transporter receptor subunit TctC [Massilia aurea]
MAIKQSGIPRRRVVSVISVVLCAGMVPAWALADTYPSKPVKVIVGFSPGGAVDNVARLLSQSMGRSMGGSFYVENRPGATGIIAAEQAAKAPADGYSILVATQSTMVVAPSIYPKMKVDPVADFTPISLLASVPMVMVVNPGVPARNVQELLAYARAQKEGLSYGSSGLGGPQHVAAELFASMGKVNMVHVPYKGEANAIADVLGNQIPVMLATCHRCCRISRAASCGRLQ